MKTCLCDAYRPLLKNKPFSDHDSSRKFMIYIGKGFGKVKNYLETDDVIFITLAARILSYS